MQQLYLTGPEASTLAVSVFRALGVRPVGYVLLPFAATGTTSGHLLHLLSEPGAPLRNDLPCRVQLFEDRSVVVSEVFNEVAAPSLRHCLNTQMPTLLDGLDTAMLACRDFSYAVAACLHSQHLVVSVVRDDAVLQVRHLSPAQEQLWLDASDAGALETLIHEVKPRL